KLTGGNTSKARGAYKVTSSTSALELAKRIRNGRQTPVNVTFNNIRTMSQLAERIAYKMEFTEKDFLEACDSILPPLGFDTAGYPAAFIPDTYEFYWTSSAQKVVEKLSGHRNRFWDVNRRNKAAALGLNPVGVATIASIVEEETANLDERPIVARLYINRLKKGMPLQADPTLKFAAGDFSLKRIGEKQISIISPYNTYLNNGLPPGPIRIVDSRTLDMVLNAPEHKYLYMCAKEDLSGTHNFAVDYATHLTNARRYHKKLNELNLKNK
ncbi:MAG: endolytic transglycosylase MltG, partial [Muribaculaceae bacterium]|nr:endolytic transglycosylase MltG [Muribaculaceae bacterium]